MTEAGGVVRVEAARLERFAERLFGLADLMDRLGLAVGGRGRPGSSGASVPGPRAPASVDVLTAMVECERWVAHLAWDLSVDASVRDRWRLRCPHPLTTDRRGLHVHPVTGELWGNCLKRPANLLRWIARNMIGWFGQDAEFLGMEERELAELTAVAGSAVDGPWARRVFIPDARCGILVPCPGRLFAELPTDGGRASAVRCSTGVESHARSPDQWLHLGRVLRQQAAEAAGGGGP